MLDLKAPDGHDMASDIICTTPTGPSCLKDSPICLFRRCASIWAHWKPLSACQLSSFLIEIVDRNEGYCVHACSHQAWQGCTMFEVHGEMFPGNQGATGPLNFLGAPRRRPCLRRGVILICQAGGTTKHHKVLQICWVALSPRDIAQPVWNLTTSHCV